MGEFVVKNYTRPTDRHKIDFLKIYLSHFFLAKTYRGTPGNPPEHAQIIPRTSQNRPQNGQKSTHVDLCSLYESILGPLKASFDQLDRTYFYLNGNALS